MSLLLGADFSASQGYSIGRSAYYLFPSFSFIKVKAIMLPQIGV